LLFPLAEAASSSSSWLTHPAFTWTLALLLAGGTVAVWMRFQWVYVSPLLGEIRAAWKVVGALPGSSRLVEEFPRVDEAMLALRRVAPAWQRYALDLLPPDVYGSTPRSLRRPEEHFHTGILEENGLNLRFYQAVPGYLVAVGLAGTFIGLIAALAVASSALSAGQASIPDILQALLAASSFKFVTSVTGLGCSVLFSILLRRGLYQLERELQTLNRCLASLAPPVSLEELTAQQWARQQQMLERLPGEIARALSGTLHDGLLRLVEPLAQQMEAVTQRLQAFSQDAVQQMVRDFRQQLHEATESQIRDLVASLSETREFIQKLTQDIAASGKTFNQELIEGADAVSARIVSAAGQMEHALGRSSASFVDAFVPMQAQMAAVAESLTRVEKSLQGHLDSFNQSGAMLGEVLKQVETTGVQLVRACEPLHATIANVEKASSAIQESNANASATLREFAQLGKVLHEASSQSLQVLEAYRGRFESIDSQLGRAVEAVGLSYERYHQAVGRFFQDLDQQLARSLGLFQAALQDLRTDEEEGRKRAGTLKE